MGKGDFGAFQSFIAPLDLIKKFVNKFLQDLILLPTDKSDLCKDFQAKIKAE